MKVCILGSTGFTGKVVLRKAVEQGHEVRVLVRTPEKLAELRDQLKKENVIVGSYFQKSDLEKAIEGTEAVLSTIGPPPKDQGVPQEWEKAMRDLVSILNEKGIRRLIHVGGAVHDGGEDEQWSFSRRVLRWVLNIVYKDGLEAKRLEWEVLKSSKDVEWTLVRPPRIAPTKPRGELVADEKCLSSLQIWVNDLADFLLELLESKEWIRKAPLVAAG